MHVQYVSTDQTVITSVIIILQDIFCTCTNLLEVLHKGDITLGGLEGAGGGLVPGDIVNPIRSVVVPAKKEDGHFLYYLYKHHSKQVVLWWTSTGLHAGSI